MSEESNNTAKNTRAGPGKATGLGERARALTAMAALAGKRGTVGGLRSVMPLIEGYARSLPVAEPGQETPKITRGGNLSFSDDELKVLRSAGAKFGYELLEITSITHPVMDEAPPYKAKPDPETGQYPAPHLAHLLSLYKAGQSLLGSKDVDTQKILQFEEGDFDEPAAESMARTGFVTEMPTGEPVVVEQSMTPQQIRRTAMRKQRYLKSQNIESAPYVSGYGGGPAYMAGMDKSAASGAESYRTSATNQKLVQAEYSGDYTPCCSGAQTSAAASAKSDSLSDRLVACLQQAACDTLYCIVAEYCDGDRSFFCEEEDGQDDVELCHCFDMFFCSVLRCLPAALCPPEPQPPVQPKPTIECSFAVEEDE